MLKIKELFWAIKRFWYLFIIVPGVLSVAIIFFTRNTEKIYDSNTIIYTGISTRKSADLTESLKIDYFTSNNLMDNIVAIINSRKTAELVSLNLLARHLSSEPNNPQLFSNETYEELKKHINEEIWKKLSVKGNFGATYNNLYKALYDSNDSIGAIKYVVSKHKYYGVSNILRRTRVIRQKSSDMVEISYYADDPGIVYQTLKFLAEVYLQRYSDLRTIENSGSIEFYLREKERIFKNLQEAEDRLKMFVSNNRIVNFYEQGKNLDNYVNDLEKEVMRSNQISQGADASLKLLEEKLQKNSVRSSLVDSLENYRKIVADKRLTLNTLLVDSSLDSERVIQLKSEIREINDLLSSKINRLYQQDFSVDGIPVSMLLGEWLDIYLQKERELSALEVSVSSFQEIYKRIDNFSPLGAVLKRLEREVGINENEYLYILAGLNQARLQNQNLKISQTQEIIDPPIFPTEARSSKRKILVLASFMFGHILLIGFFAAKLLLNNTLQEQYNTEKTTGLKVLSSFPKFSSYEESEYFKISSNILANELTKIAHQLGDKPALTIAIHPIVEDDDFELILQKVLKSIPNYLTPIKIISSKGISPYTSYEVSEYINTPILSHFISSKKEPDVFNIINFLVLPPYREINHNVKFLSEVDWHILYSNANYTWKGSDTMFVNWLRSIARENLSMVLTKVDINFIKDLTRKN